MRKQRIEYNVVYNPRDEVVRNTQYDDLHKILTEHSRLLFTGHTNLVKTECGGAYLIKLDSVCGEQYVCLVTLDALKGTKGELEDIRQVAESMLWGPRGDVIILNINKRGEIRDKYETNQKG